MNYLLHHLLVRAAEKHPQREAVVFGSESISYRELDLVTNRLANLLLENGVRRGDRVGIYMNKSIPSIISIHGILKAGAVYVPLDPNAPTSRHSYIVDNCQIKTILVSTLKQKQLKEIMASSNSIETVVLTDDKNDVDEAPGATFIPWQDVKSFADDSSPQVPSIETDLAYILYTSGSTGTPKGVMISHLNSLTFVRWVYDTFEFSEEDRFSNHAPLHFDLSILDIFVAFMSGATLVPVPEGLSSFPVRLSRWIQENQITVWYSVPSILSMLVLHGQLEKYDFSRLRMIFFAGEVFPVKYLRELMKKIPHPRYLNLYGPTETNVITYYEMPGIPPDEQTKPIPIGKTCANMEVFALTEDGKLVRAPGEEGELVARGSCVAQGYWGDAEKTAKGFVENPLQKNFSDRMYKTGDLVTLDEDGNYIYMGRKDHMIKSRGYRIEIGEIEAAIYSHPDVKEAAVIALPDDLIGNRIKAVLALQNGKTLSAADVRMFCSEKVPKYMIPELVEFREQLPKTSTGKVDKPTLLRESVEQE